MENMQTETNVEEMRHSLAHIMANAIQRLWPDAKFGVGPVVENGFYYDVDLGDIKLSEANFKQIESEMKKIIADNEPFESIKMGIDQAIEWAQQSNQPYKLELLNDLKREGTTNLKDLNLLELGVANDNSSKVESVSFYRNGDFTDLCKGPHVATTGQVGAFKLLRISGAYWRGQTNNPQMQRVYGLAFSSEAELKKQLESIELAKQRDHRKLGQELDLFTFSELVGSGLPLFTPRGTVLRDNLNDYSQELQQQYGFERVWTPHMASEELYKKSGHLDKFPERFTVTSVESDEKFMMKPMNCPHHIQIFARKPWSYRELPVRYMENTTNYRDEKSGELHGLARVRSLSQDDGHIFCQEDNLEVELNSIIKMVVTLYKVLNLDYFARVSVRDKSGQYLGDPTLWEKAETIIKQVASNSGIKTVEGIGEAAFYGPKIDFMINDSLQREWQCATIQVDFVLPERFGLEYIDKDGSTKRPVIIHKALLGAVERFLAVYIEHTAGRFPVWLAPEQVRLLTVNQEDRTVVFANEIADQLRQNGVRFTIDNSNESVGKKIRSAEIMKIPYSVVIGDKEIESKLLQPRIRTDIGLSKGAINIDTFVSAIVEETNEHLLKSSLSK
jgi:threonyl-tRNA synthetase